MDSNTSRETHIRDFLKDSLKEMMAVLKAECGSLFLFDDKTEELVLESFCNSAAIPVSNVKCRLGEGIPGKVVESKAPVLVKDIDQDSRFRRNGFKHYHTKSFISVPLTTPDGLIGLMNIADKSTREPFSEKDLEFATTLAQYACIIAYNLALSEKLRREKDELDKQKALLEKYASVGKLAAGVVHEVNNPLDGIIRFTNMLMQQIDEHSPGKEYLLEIKRGLNRIENVTKSLLQFSHQVNNSFRHATTAELHELIEESLYVLTSQSRTDIQVHRQYGVKKVRLTDLGLSHVFINLIKNACDAMPEGGRLDIITHAEPEAIRIIVRDTGMGMSRQVQEKIFEPFFTTKSKEKGTGLGLAICREIVNRYEGTIEVRSQLAQGSTFTVTIPRKHLSYA